MHRGFVQIWWSRHVSIIGLTAPCLYHLAWSVSGSPASHQQRTLYLFLSLFSPPFQLNLGLGNHGSAWPKVEVMSFQKLLLILQCSNAAAGSQWGSPSVAVYSKIKLDVSLSAVQLITVISMYSHFPRRAESQPSVFCQSASVCTCKHSRTWYKCCREPGANLSVFITSMLTARVKYFRDDWDAGHPLSINHVRQQWPHNKKNSALPTDLEICMGAEGSL